MKFGSVCSGIEAASVALTPLGFEASWFSEIADFPSRVLKHHYPDIPNHGDMNDLPYLIESGVIEAPDMLCGGTPCQAFSLAGWKQGLNDTRGKLTLKFIEIADAIDKKRKSNGKGESIVLWENVEGVLKDKTNAFGIFISGLAGLDEELPSIKWSLSGVLYGKNRNLAWRVLDAKYFGLPQQRRRLFLIATNTNIDPKSILFEQTKYSEELFSYKKNTYIESNNNKENELSLFSSCDNDKIKFSNIQYIDSNKFEVFREYTDCLYTAYGTKWNGNAAAYNGSLYIAQNDKVRRLTPLECERLMGFPDGYTSIPNNRDTNRYQAVGNSWAVPVVRWIGNQINRIKKNSNMGDIITPTIQNKNFKLFLFDNDFIQLDFDHYLNVSVTSNNILKGNIFNIVQNTPHEKFYISSKGSDGILRRKNERNIKMNERLEYFFKKNNDFKSNAT
jgi:DNA (cytosine-5)-methyltransferase 1